MIEFKFETAGDAEFWKQVFLGVLVDESTYESDGKGTSRFYAAINHADRAVLALRARQQPKDTYR